MGIARVLHIESGSGFGGSASGLVNMVPKLAREGFDPVVGYFHKGLNIEELERLGMPTIRIRPWAVGMDVYRLIRRHGTQLVHFNNELYSHVPGILAATTCGARRVCHMRGIRRFTRREHLAKHMIDHFVAISDVGFDLYRGEGVPPNRIRRIYNSIDLTRYAHLPPRQTMRRLLGLPGEATLIGFVSRVEPLKGHQEFLEAVAHVVRERPDVIFVVVGGDVTPQKDFLPGLVRWVARHDLTRNVRFLGWRRDIPEVTSAFDIAIQASKYVEGLGRSLLEAMAISLPVVATRTGGFCEVVEDGVTGLLAPVGDGPALGAAVLALLRDPVRAQRMGEAGRERVARLFDAKVQIQEFKQLFLDVLRAPTRAWYSE